MVDQKSKQATFPHQGEYMRLALAAEQVGSTAAGLLHLGALGKVDILAPVLAEGWYEWPVSSTGIPHPENETRFASVKFGTHHRVMLAHRDVAKIEAVGWVTPRAFFCPEAAEEHIEFWKDVNPRVYAQLQKSAESVPWFAIEPAEQSETQPQLKDELKVTAEHLFVSRREIERLKKDAPQDQAANERKVAAGEDGEKLHGNSLRFSRAREEVLTAAIACLFNERKIEMKGTDWARLVDEKAQLFWKARNAPLARSAITKLLNEAKAYPDAPQWEGREEK